MTKTVKAKIGETYPLVEGVVYEYDGNLNGGRTLESRAGQSPKTITRHVMDLVRNDDTNKALEVLEKSMFIKDPCNVENEIANLMAWYKRNDQQDQVENFLRKFDQACNTEETA